MESGFSEMLGDHISIEEREVAAMRERVPDDPLLADTNADSRTSVREELNECTIRMCRFLKQHEGEISLNHVAIAFRDSEEAAIKQLFDDLWERRAVLRDKVQYIRGGDVSYGK